MPLVAHIPSPTLDYLRKRGENVLELGQALDQDIRELHIGFLNMMPRFGAGGDGTTVYAIGG